MWLDSVLIGVTRYDLPPECQFHTTNTEISFEWKRRFATNSCGMRIPTNCMVQTESQPIGNPCLAPVMKTVGPQSTSGRTRQSYTPHHKGLASHAICILLPPTRLLIHYHFFSITQGASETVFFFCIYVSIFLSHYQPPLDEVNITLTNFRDEAYLKTFNYQFPQALLHFFSIDNFTSQRSFITTCCLLYCAVSPPR
jgi:hypothetical protein